MKQILTTLLCVTLIGLISCQKDINEELPLNADSADTLLSSILVFDTITPKNDLTLLEFIYDDQKRVTEIKETNFDSTNGSITIHDQYSDYYYYHGNNKNPYKSYGYTRYVYGDYEVFHFYDDKGRLILDSLGAPDQSFMLNHFDYSADKMVLTSSIYDENGDLFSEYSDSCFFAAGNVSKAFIYFPLTQAGEVAFEYTYDDKINPLSKLNIAASQGMDQFAPLDKFWFLPFGYCRNNIVTRLGYSDYPGGTPYTREYNFTYNSNNLPVYGVFKVDGNDQEGIRIALQYTH